MQVGALFAYPSVQCTGRFFAVVRTLLPVRIAELLFCVPKCAPKRQVRAHRDANGTTALRNNPYRPGDAAGNGYFAASAGVSSSSSLAMTSS